MGLFPRDRNLARAPREVELEVRASDFQLPLHEVEIRLDAFLKRALPWRSRTAIQSLIREGLVSVEGAGGPSAGPSALAVELRSSRVLRHGARVVVRIPPELQLPDSTADPGDLSILYEDEVDTSIQSLTSIIEPVMMIGVGIMVGTIVISMYLPMFKMLSLVK